jgi:hypothetical protein
VQYDIVIIGIEFEDLRLNCRPHKHDFQTSDSRVDTWTGVRSLTGRNFDGSGTVNRDDKRRHRVIVHFDLRETITCDGERKRASSDGNKARSSSRDRCVPPPIAQAIAYAICR